MLIMSILTKFEGSPSPTDDQNESFEARKCGWLGWGQGGRVKLRL